MNDLNNQKLEEILIKTLEYLDSGKSPVEILDLFPENQEILKEIFFTIDLLKREGRFITPPKELFKRIIEQIPDSITNEVNARYSYQKEVVKGRPSLSNITTKVHNRMTINWKVWTPIGIVAVAVLVIVGFSQFSTKAPQAPVAGETPQAPIAASTQELPVAVIKPATGNVDDAVDAILAAVFDDQALFADEAKDAELVAADSQAISDFGQSYNEKEF